MSEFNQDKLFTNIMPPATMFYPIDGRKYTLTHSDTTGNLFLSIGYQHDLSKINTMLRDEVLAEWKTNSGQYHLSGKVHVSHGEFDEKLAHVRFMIFERELPLALKAIVNGDKGFYTYFPWLLDSSIFICFDSVFPEYQQVKYFGTPRQYLIS